MKIFLISPVRVENNLDLETRIAIEMYVKSLKGRGYKVHWPKRDTNQNDHSGGYEICLTNFQAMLDADQIHIWYEETSNGSKFDMGGVFMLKMLGIKKDIIIVNREEAEALDKSQKSFLKVMKHLAD